MSDIYLSLTETPSVVTLSQPVVSGVLNSTVTVANVVSVNVVTMPAITVQAAAPSVTTVGGTVTVGNFPATQTISGTVTANVVGLNDNNSPQVFGLIDADGSNSIQQTSAVAATLVDNDGYSIFNTTDGERGIPIAGRVGAGNAIAYITAENNRLDTNVKNSVTIGSLPAISGTVTLGNSVTIGSILATVLPRWEDDNQGGNQRTVKQSTPFPVRIYGDASSTSVTFGATIANSVTIGSLPAISGTVTVGNSVTVSALPSGALTTRFGSVTTANLSQITTAVTNTSRKYLLAQNISAGTVTIGIGFSPTTTQGIQLTAGGGLTFDAFCPTGAVYWLGAVTGAAFTILEG